eukprot:XP_001703636.1 predicted protein [Chlamydomonas reinhardtii]
MCSCTKMRTSKLAGVHPHLHPNRRVAVAGDLKPSNVLLSHSSKDRRGFVAKVADFGLSKLLNDNAKHVLSDQFGTVAYSSPEAINGNHSKASDVGGEPPPHFAGAGSGQHYSQHHGQHHGQHQQQGRGRR